MTWMTYFWFFAVGASVGSFANVVAYRVPRGMSVAWPPSRCSSCGQPVQLRDNIPIISWLRLGGRCRHCAAPFSVRYLLVELAFGLMFVAFGQAELLSGGANLPNWPVPAYTGPVWILWYPKWGVILITLFHIRLVSHLYVWSLAQWDGQRLPPSHRFGDVAVALLLPAVLPFLHTVGVFYGLFLGGDGPTWANMSVVWAAELRLPDWLARWTGTPAVSPTFSCDQLAVGLVGAAVSGGLAWCCARVAGMSKTTAIDTGFIGSSLGATLGWQGGLLGVLAANVCLLAGAVGCRWAGCRCLNRGVGFAWAVAVPTTMLLWEQLRVATNQMGIETGAVRAAILAAVAVASATVTRLLSASGDETAESVGITIAGQPPAPIPDSGPDAASEKTPELEPSTAPLQPPQLSADTTDG
jgi:prepilin signal peptidase PulO-like enzyme (type II secretory pathway)